MAGANPSVKPKQVSDPPPPLSAETRPGVAIFTHRPDLRVWLPVPAWPTRSGLGPEEAVPGDKGP